MVTHDFSRPIPPGTLRISVIWNDHLHTADLPTPKIPNTIRAFEEFAGLVLSAHAEEVENACTAAATAAADAGDDHVVTTAALCRYLFDPQAGWLNTDRLRGILDADGSGLLTAMTDATGTDWTFKLFEMPRWPASVRPHRAADRDRRRRFR